MGRKESNQTKKAGFTLLVQLDSGANTWDFGTSCKKHH